MLFYFKNPQSELEKYYANIMMILMRKLYKIITTLDTEEIDYDEEYIRRHNTSYVSYFRIVRLKSTMYGRPWLMQIYNWLFKSLSKQNRQYYDFIKIVDADANDLLITCPCQFYNSYDQLNCIKRDVGACVLHECPLIKQMFAEMC